MAEESERPFKAEYAKSGRAGCKLCKGNIAQNSLRLAKMVQSPFFDGKVPNWFHFSCFFKHNKLHATNEISGFGSLRWEDQQKLKAKAEGAESTDGPGNSSGSSSGKGRKITRSDLQVEYAKSSKSTCRGCNSLIDKGEVRVAKLEEANPEERGSFVGLIPAWHHLECFLERLEELEAQGVLPEELSGFTKLKKPDKEMVAKKMSSKRGSGKGKGKKRKAEAQPPAIKKTKEDVVEEKALKEQSQLLWKIRDELKANLKNADIKELLQANNQAIPSGESQILDRCADGMVFGALKPCSDCGGQLVARSHCYQCTGNISAWTKCTLTTTEPEREKWVIPEDFLEVPFLKKFRFKARQRLFEAEPAPQSSSVDCTDGPGRTSTKTKVEAPLRGFTAMVIGRLSKSKPELTREIEALGGKVVSKVTENTTICISNKNELDKASKRMVEVEECEVPVVGEDYLTDAAKGGALLKIPSHTISTWGAPRHSLPVDKSELGKSFKSMGPSKMKLTVKGAAAVDPQSELEDSHHVLEEGKVVWNAVLGLVDVVRGTNSYYKLQLLEGDSSRSYYVFRSWGRVGTTIGGTKSTYHAASKQSAKTEFQAVYADKTGNSWDNRDSFVKHPSKFYPLEIDYGQDQEDSAQLSSLTMTQSKLAPELQELIKMIFDVDSMKKTMLEFEIDMKKMPLGKLSKRQIESAYSVLTELQNEISGAKNPSRILDASNRFYTLIPHDFGLRKPPLLDTVEVISAKTQMLDNLLEIEVAYSLLKQEEGSATSDPLDAHYRKLKTDLEVVPRDSEEYQMLQDYVSNTHGATHTQYDLELQGIFKLARHGEDKRYKAFQNLHNRMLLWHGSRTTNYVGILSQGLRIAPPEAPATGYMFGKGVYFADMVSKSANYCHTSKADPIGLMLLCEVALGDMYELTHAQYITKLPASKHSTKGMGRTGPDPKGGRTTDTGVCIPMGKGTSTSCTHTSLLYNEYIVYDVSQISVKYLLKMNFKYKW